MANAFLGEVEVQFRGENFTLLLDFNAVCEFESLTGKNGLKTLEGMEKGEVSASDMRALMCAGLRQKHPEMTLQLAGSILGENLDAIQRASELAKPELKPGNVVRSPGKRAKAG